jgi:uncharacterized cupredoxin-like copper-binding protein
MASQPHRLLSPLLVAIVLAGLPGCTDTTPPGRPVDVTLKDFSMTPQDQTIAAGDVLLRVTNEAPVTHEFVVVRTDLPADALPIAPDGLSVNEEWLAPMGELGEVRASAIGELPLNLPPGRYVFFCNLEGHYLGGMHAVLEVTG